MWSVDACECLQESGAEFLIVINGSPFEATKQQQRLDLARTRVKESGLPLLYVNQVGGQDELVFDGASFALATDGDLRVQAPEWRPALMPTRWKREANGWNVEKGVVTERGDRLSSIYQAMVLGLSDYVRKNKFPGVVLGLSGGIDSALSAAVAVDALGADRVHCVMMPSPYTSKESLEDAAAVAEFLECELRDINIGPAMEAYRTMLAPSFEGREPDITEENIQSRSRAVVLMAMSNKFGYILLNTSNKSEAAVGYGTLYGDMCGGISVLGDVYKTQVYDLANHINRDTEIIPVNSITKPPSAELRPGQKDSDSLPEYDILDTILMEYIEHRKSSAEIIALGYDEAVVKRVMKLVNSAEHKRYQTPPILRVSPKAFGMGRRMPIVGKYLS